MSRNVSAGTIGKGVFLGTLGCVVAPIAVVLVVVVVLAALGRLV